MIVVSNTSPVINLACVGQLFILQKLYGKIVIPQIVYDEIVVMGAEHYAVKEIQTRQWIERKQVMDSALLKLLEMELDKGEAHAIALAIELKADFLLLDEQKGRSVASRLDIRYIGLLGALVEAKGKGYVKDIKPVLDELMTKAGFWISKDLYKRVLQAAGE